MTVAVAVDFGTSSTCVAVSVNAEPARLVVIDGSPLMPSAVYADGRTLFVGAEAVRQAAVDPARYEATPKRRIDEDSLLLGDTIVGVQRVIAAVLSRAVREARTMLGGAPVDVLVLTHPADWGAPRIALLGAAGSGLAATVTTMPEPVAAAVQHGSDAAADAWLAVLDVGAGTTDVSVLRHTQNGFRVVVTRGNPHFGGADIDEMLMAELGARLGGTQRPLWDAVAHGQGLEERRRRRALRADVRGAKESLSRHSYADVPLPDRLPDGHVTRADLERLMQEQVGCVVDLLAAALADAGAVDAAGRCHAEVFLVGGSSRIPLFATTVHQRLGVLPVSTDQPETVVARGALRALGATTRAAQLRAPAIPQAARGAGAAPDGQAPGSRGNWRRRRWVLAVAAVMVAGVIGAVTVVVGHGTPSPAGRVAASQRATVTVPAGWQETLRTDTGANARLELTPDGNPPRSQGLFLVQTSLDPEVTLTDVAGALRSAVSVETAAGKMYEAFDTDARYGDRPVISYREVRRDSAVVEWYVMLQEHTQVSVGCQHPAADSATMTAPCEQAVRTVRVGTF